MKKLKKKISLCMAFVMVFSMLTPFAISVNAAIQSTGTTLFVWPTETPAQDARLGGGFDGAPVSFIMERTTPNDVMLYWEIDPDQANAGARGLYVLRYFTSAGDKIELLVQRGTDAGGSFVRVSGDGFERLDPDDPNDDADILAGLTYREPIHAEVAMNGDPEVTFRQYGFGDQAFHCPIQGHVIMRTLWGTPQVTGGNPNHFYVFLEGGLSLGLVYDFTLEFYPAANPTTITNNYRASVMRRNTWRPNETRPTGAGAWPRYDADRSDRIFVFTGFATRDIEVFPFAESHAGAHTLVSGTTFGAFPWARDLIMPFPLYETHALDLDANERPAAPLNGLDIRIQLPRFFSEADGQFTMSYADGVSSHGIPNPGSEIMIGPMGPQSPYGFRIDTIISDLVNYTAGSTGTAGATLVKSEHAPADMMLQNASMLTRAGGGEVARFSVVGLPPSIVFESIRVTLVPPGTPAPNFASRVTSLDFDPLSGPRLHTFLEYEFTPPIAGISTAEITPFRWHTGLPIIGQYRLRRTNLLFGGVLEPPISAEFNAETDVVRIPVLSAGDSVNPEYHFIEFAMGIPAAMRSQTVVHVPDRTPTVSSPNIFRIVRGIVSCLEGCHDIHMTPIRGSGTPPMYADLSFWAEWQLGNRLSIWDMLNNQGGEATLLYQLNRSATPNYNEFEAYADVWVTLQNLTARGEFEVVDFRVDFHGEDPTTRASDLHLHFLANGMVNASVNVITEAVHINEGMIMPAADWQNPFRFPGAPYFMNIGVVGLYSAIGDDRDDFVINFIRWPISPMDYVVLDDFGSLTPPPPSNLRVTADTDPASPPSLDVAFNVAAASFNTWLAEQYSFSPVIYANLYIGAFEDTIVSLANVNPLTLINPPGEFRGVHFDHDYSDFVYIPPTDPGDPPAPPTIDMSHPDVQAALRGSDGGVVRIADISIPLSVGGMDIPDAIDATQAWLDHGPIPNVALFHVTLNELDENRRYFVFADLVVHRYTTADSLLPGESVGDLIGDEVDRSVATPIVGGVTVGTPTKPGPEEVDPAAPTGLDHLDPTETEVTLYWNAIRPLDANVVIEFEIIRVSDNPLTDEELGKDLDEDEPLPTLGEMVTGREDAVGWRTGAQANPTYLQVYTDSQTPSNLTLGQDDPEEQPYTYYDPAQEPLTEDQVSLTDRTLRPNSLYYYYVRTVRRVYDANGDLIAERRSTWVQDSVTTPVVQAPTDLREENGSTRHGFDPLTQVLVSWAHRDMAAIIRDEGETLIFQYQLRADGGDWGTITNTTIQQLTNPENFMAGRLFYMVRGLEPGTSYEMRVRLRDIENDDASVWSNIITFMTEFDQGVFDLNRDVNDWSQFLRRQLEEMLRRPFWFVQDTPTSSIIVYRPEGVFAGLMLDSPGAVPLHNTDTNSQIIYLPATIIRDANENRKGFSTRYSDLDILFAPLFLNADHNQAVMDMVRALNARDSELSDYFIRLDFNRVPTTEIFGVPSIARQTNVSASLVPTGRNIRSIRSWERTVLDRATRIVNAAVEDPIMHQNIRNLLIAGAEPEDMLDYVDTVVSRISNDITKMVSDDMHARSNGILSTRSMSVTEFDSAMFVVATAAGPETSVNAFRQQAGQWIPQNTIQFAHGRAIASRTPGTFAFTGRTVNIPGIENVPRGNTVTSIVARHGLEDLFGLNIDLQQNATRQMVVGSMARIAGAPHGADLMNWGVANLNVNLSSRNATGLISQQEAIAVAMAVYEHRTNTRVNTIAVRNFQNTAGMQLDNRYAQAVRAAFEVGMITDNSFNPAGPITIGEFLNMLAELTSRVTI
jgi:hypothetical protein